MESHPAAWNRAEGKDIATFKQLSKNPTYSRHPIYPMIHSKPQRYPDLFRRCSELRVVLYFLCQPAKLEFSFLTVTKSVILHPRVQKMCHLCLLFYYPMLMILLEGFLGRSKLDSCVRFHIFTQKPKNTC